MQSELKHGLEKAETKQRQSEARRDTKRMDETQSHRKKERRRNAVRGGVKGD